MAHNKLNLNEVHEFGLNFHKREVYAHSSFGSEEDAGLDFRCAINFVKNITILDSSGDPILVHLHVDGGGSWTDGMAMFDVVRNAISPVTFIVYSEAMSMTGIILQSADLRLVMPNAELMIHYGNLEICGTSLAADSANKSNRKSMKKMLQVFSARAISGPYFVKKGYTKPRIESYIDRMLRKHSDWYLDAEQAVDYGFADRILDGPLRPGMWAKKKAVF